MSQMQTRSSTRVTDSSAGGFESFVALSLPMLTEQIKTGDYRQIQELCRFIGISAKGARPELEIRILDFKSKLDAGEVTLPTSGTAPASTPERREGRKRSPHRGSTVVPWPKVGPLPAYDPIEEDASIRGPDTLPDPWLRFIEPLQPRSDHTEPILE